MAVAKVLTRKKFGKGTLMETMYSASGADREVSFQELESNLFVLQAFCLGDRKRIIGGSKAISQIHKLPHLYRSQEVIKKLASRVGEVLAIDPAAVPTIRGDFSRARVRLVADAPLTRVVPLSPEGQECMLLPVLYEKIPRFCEFCGLMGHDKLECGTGEHAEEDLQFGDWMLSDEALWRPGTPGMRAGRFARGQRGRGGRSGFCGGRADGRGRGGERVFLEWKPHQPAESGGHKHSSTDAGLEENEDLGDTASSPLKAPTEVNQADTGDLLVKKKLDMDGGDLAMVGYVPPPPPQYIPPREQKRAKKARGTGDEKTKVDGKAHASTSGSATSLEEDRRAQ
ncbi:hypothetical protein BRADI_2g47343v3 [Brachypodium distachyon]|uniref:Uncharacterized protein n=1 Tax=Brachypodium distachyon TaxID=15368 RepID=A0A2K2DEF0_BRADI|nr:hypothetical protein BRADI_2g47343v3 [Brachypodium distachyon]